MMKCDFSWMRVAPLLEKHNKKPNVVQPANRGIPHLFKVGDRVRCNYKKRGRWYPGQIVEKQGGGTFYVVYDDNDQESGVVE
eukprot:1386162-Amorphochlora_amoeboformis.AAC.1